MPHNHPSGKLRICEIFKSIQGESLSSGFPTIFIRLTGCPLRCIYCDSDYAFSGGKFMSISDIVTETVGLGCRYITVTGGEPLIQSSCHLLLKKLCDKQLIVSLETNGCMDIQDVDDRVIKVMDIKTPGSSESKNNLLENIKYLSKKDQVKIVICSKEDYIWSKKILSQYQLTNICEVIFSPFEKTLSPTALADWMVADNLNVRLQIQLHKYLWGNDRGK